MQYLLAHDLGTSGDKAVLYSTEGQVLAETTAAYVTSYPFSKAAEQNPEDWWAAFCAMTKSLLEQTGNKPGDILAVSFSAQMNSCLPVDISGKPLRPAMIWADQRAEKEAAAITEKLGADAIYKMTGQRLGASLGIAKMAWFMRHEPALYHQTAKFIQPKDYLIFQLTGRLVSDYSDASHLACFDLGRMAWSSELLGAAGIHADKMPELLPSIAIAGKVSRQASLACGLKEGTPVVMGGGDGPCATAGAGISRSGQTYCSLGTSAWIATLFESPYLDPQKRTFNLLFLDGKQTMSLGATQTAGLALSWAVDTLFSETAGQATVYRELDQYTAAVPAGCDGLLFLPYLLGERSPWWNANASGCFIGLHPLHERKAMLRAVMEGVGFNLKLILDALQEGCEIKELTVVGGGARNRAWLTILADIWQKPVKVPSMLEYAGSGGAALCAGIGTGVFTSLDAAAEFNPVREIIQPDPKNAAVYQKALERFNRIYSALDKTVFNADSL